jgi:hypothetical protein
MNYNTYINEQYSENNMDIDQYNYILPKNDNSKPNNILNNIVQHPFIDSLSININLISLNNNTQTCNIILYRYRSYNNYHYIEYYLPCNTETNQREIITNNIYSKGDCLITYINENRNDIIGTKRLKGYITYNNELFGVIQVRDTNNSNDINNNDWITLWDIIVYKQVFREKIQKNIIEFFLTHHSISSLYVNNYQCVMPIILYCNIPEIYSKYIQNTNSIQYCKKENGPLIFLSNNYKNEDNNVRNICFIQDVDFSVTQEKLLDKTYIINKYDNKLQYIFKTDEYIISCMK